MRSGPGALFVALGLSACLAPPALLPARKLDRDALGAYPEDTQRIELVADGDRLRGVFVPADPGSPVVLHLLEATGSVATRGSGLEVLVRQLADLGFASLIVDYSGVGLSDGEPDVDDLRRDASAMWAEAVRRADGDPSAVVLRGVSIGCIAAGLLLQDGARPGAVVLHVPVFPDTVVERFARLFHGRGAALFASVAYRDVARLDLGAVLDELDAPLLLVVAEREELVPEDQLDELARIAHPRHTLVAKPGNHFVVADAAHRLGREELSLFTHFFPGVRDEPGRDAELYAALSPEERALAPEGPEETAARARFRAAAAWSCGGPARHVLAAALADVDPLVAARLRWRYALRAPKNDELEGLVALYRLDDPAGPLPLDLLERLSEPHDRLALEGTRMCLLDERRIASTVAALDGGAGHGDWSITIHLAEGVDAGIEFRPTDVWTELVARGLPRPAARRQMARLLLKTFRIPDRVRSDPGGDVVLEVLADDGWRELDVEHAEARDDEALEISFPLPR